MFPLIVAVLTMLILILLLPTVHEIIHWLVLVGVRVRVSKYNVNYGVSMDLPHAPNYNSTSYLQSTSTLTQILF